MKKTINITLTALLLVFGRTETLSAQESYNIHSHNDYKQNLPFWYAYSNGAASIEVDVFLKNDTLYVTHHKDEIVSGHTLEGLYLDRLKSLMQSGELRDLQFLIDLKSEAYTTLDKLVAVLESYPLLLKSQKVRFLISGNRPSPSDYGNYPDFIWFDHQNLDELDTINLAKVALVSVSYKNYSVWNGYGRMTSKDLQAVRTAIKKAADTGIPFRFWATPDTKTAWSRLAKLGVDYINTDTPALAKQYLENLNTNTFQNETPIMVYDPTYRYDPNAIPQNIVLMIGDGNGLAQISAAMIANRGQLTITNLKDIGLVKTASSDDLVTDSAAGGTAIATGSKTNNRAIGVTTIGKPLQNLVDIVNKQGYNTAIVSTDAIYGATPSSFYAHRIERDNTEGILTDLNNSALDFFMAGGQAKEPSISKKFFSKTLDSFDGFDSPTVVYLGKNSVPPLKERKNIFPKSVKKALEVLNAKEEPFFLMVEGAQIDNGGHENDIAKIIGEMLDFDQAVAEALRFADATKNTLVIITADHETSGLGIVGGNLNEGIVQADFLTIDHTGIPVPLFAYGPQSHSFRGFYENTLIFHKILEALGLK